MIKHAKLSASGAHRWLNCPGSVKAEENLPDKQTIFAQEGSGAHELAEIALLKRINPFDWVDKPLITENAIIVNQEMAANVQRYIDYINQFDGQLFVETRVDFSHWVQEGFGTADAIIINNDVIRVIDLKYGKGVKVYADDNPQGMLYALGALSDFGVVYDFKTVEIAIVQPRIDHISEWSISVDDLLKWGEWVKERVELTLTDNAPLIPSRKACQWCKAKSTCEQAYTRNKQSILNDFEIVDS